MKDLILQTLSAGYVPFFIFLLWSLWSFLIGFTRFYEYYKVQRVPSTRLFATVNLAQGVALFLAALVISPHPSQDFDHLRSWSRLAWAIGLPFFLIAVPVHIWYVYTIKRLRDAALLKDSMIVDASPYAKLDEPNDAA